MHAAKRLALATCAGLAIAAALSGPAMADPGGLLQGVTETLPPVVAEPVEDVGSTAEQLVEQVQTPVNGALEDTAQLVDETVTGVTQTVDETVNGVRETVAPAVVVDVGSTKPDTAAPVPADPASMPQTSAAPSAVSPDVSARAVSPPVKAESGAQMPSVRRKHAGSSVTVAAVERVAPVGTAAAVTGGDLPVVVTASPNGGPEPAPVQPPRFLGDSSIFGGSVPQPPSALLIALLLGALALAAPRAVGRRLHPAVALLHPADVRFRLVRPG